MESRMYPSINTERKGNFGQIEIWGQPWGGEALDKFKIDINTQTHNCCPLP